MLSTLSLALALVSPPLPAAVPQDQAWKQSELEELTRKLQGDLEALRGVAFLRDVAVKVATKQDLIEYMKRRMQEDEPPERLAADEVTAKLLGLFPAEKDLLAETYALLESQVGGFYDPPSNTFWLMEGMPRSLAAPILAHELIHALDDQHYDIDSQLEARKDNSDALQAYRFVVEGSGTAGGNRWTLDHVEQIDMSGYQDLMDDQQESLLRAPTFLWKPLLGAYMQGAAFLARSDSVLTGQMAELVPADIDAAFRDLPRSTEQVLHPEKYWDPARRDEPRAVDLSVSELPRGWKELRQDTFGELGLAQIAEAGLAPDLDMSSALAMASSLMGLAYTHPAAEGWGGDRMLLVGDGEGWWLRLVTCWDSERDAGEFYAACVYQSPRFEAAARVLHADDSGAEVAYGAARDEVVLTIWSGVSRSARRRIDRAVKAEVAPAQR